MPHTVLFCLQIAQVIRVGCHLDRYILDDFQPVGLQTDSFHRVVGQQAHLVNTQMAQHLRATAVVALVGLETQMDVGVNRIEALFLQFIGCDLVHQTYSPAFLLHIDHHTLAFLLDGLHGLV